MPLARIPHPENHTDVLTFHDHTVFNCGITLQEQEMIAEAYKEAKEIWAKMSEEELAVHGPNEAHMRIEEALNKLGLLDTDVQESKPHHAPSIRQRRWFQRLRMNLNIFSARKAPSNPRTSPTDDSARISFSPFKSFKVSNYTPWNILNGWRSKKSSTSTKLTAATITNIEPIPIDVPRPTVERKSRSDSAILMKRPRKLETVQELQEPLPEQPYTEMMSMKRPWFTRRATIDDPSTHFQTKPFSSNWPHHKPTPSTPTLFTFSLPMPLPCTSHIPSRKLSLQHISERKKLWTADSDVVGFDPLAWCYSVLVNIAIDISITFVWTTLMGCLVGFCMVRIIGRVTGL